MLAPEGGLSEGGPSEGEPPEGRPSVEGPPVGPSAVAPSDLCLVLPELAQPFLNTYTASAEASSETRFS